jgi:hypothetical protein
MRAQISTQPNTGTKPAGLFRLFAMLVLVMAVLSPLAAQAQGNYVYVNNQTAANSVSAYSVSATGALTQLSGSPFSTGGVGANVVCYGLNRITLSQINNLIFVANTGDRTITSFQINPASGRWQFPFCLKQWPDSNFHYRRGRDPDSVCEPCYRNISYTKLLLAQCRHGDFAQRPVPGNLKSNQRIDVHYQCRSIVIGRGLAICQNRFWKPFRARLQLRC